MKVPPSTSIPSVGKSIRFSISILLLFACATSQGQSLMNSEWIRIKSERKDGSRIIARSTSTRDVLANSAVRLSFKDTVLTISYDGEISNGYIVADNILSMGYYDNWGKFILTSKQHIDTLTNTFLILTENSNEKSSDDKSNRYTYIRSKYYLQYLITNKEISIFGDSLIQCNKLLFPYFKGNIDYSLRQQIAPLKGNELAAGSLTFAPNGTVRQINIERIENLSIKQVEKFKNVLLGGEWKTPININHYSLKMDFVCTSYKTQMASAYGTVPVMIRIRYNSYDNIHPNDPILSDEAIQKATLYYHRGAVLLQRQKYQEAITKFQQCLAIDSLHIDSYYNKAYAHFQLKETKLACESWKKLMELGQKEGEKLFMENCKGQ